MKHPRQVSASAALPKKKRRKHRRKQHDRAQTLRDQSARKRRRLFDTMRDD